MNAPAPAPSRLVARAIHTRAYTGTYTVPLSPGALVFARSFLPFPGKTSIVQLGNSITPRPRP